MTRITVLAVTVLAALAPWPGVSADTPPPSPPKRAAQLSESDAIQIAENEATRLKIDLEHFEPPSATYVSNGRYGKWHIFFVAKSHEFDACFSVDIYRSDERPRFAWCS